MFQLIRFYTTPRGVRGVIYLLDGQRGASLLPHACRTVAHVRAWLRQSLGRPLEPAPLEPLEVDGLEALAARVYGPSQARSLALGRDELREVHLEDGGRVRAVMRASDPSRCYHVRLDPGARQARCSCPFARRSADPVVCKHAAALARLLRVHPELGAPAQAPAAGAVRLTEFEDGLATGWVWLEDARLGVLELVGPRGRACVRSEDVYLGGLEALDGQLGAWVAWVPGTLEGLEAIAPWPHAPRARPAAA